MAAQKPETKFRAAFTKRLDEMQGIWHESIQQLTIQGTPDKLLCVNGYFAALEFKASEKAEPTELQKHKLRCIRRAGGMAFVPHPDNAEAVLAAIQKVAQGQHPDTTRRVQWEG